MTQPTASTSHAVITQDEPARYFTEDTNPGETKYVCPADGSERNRLNMQHRLLTALYENVLVPKSIELRAGDRILDCGTGTGAWAIDAAASVPAGVQVYAIDIEPRLWPNDRPDNTSFSVHSAASLPADWSASFTFVHQRFLIGALDLPTLQSALTQIYRVLKPGCVARLVELLNVWFHMPNTADGEQWSNTPHTGRLVALLKSLFAARNLVDNCGDRLPVLLEEAGFEAIERDDRFITFGPGDKGEHWREDLLTVCKALKAPVLKAGGFGLVHSEEDFDELMRNLEAEWDANEIQMDFVALTARKPANVST